MKNTKKLLSITLALLFITFTCISYLPAKAAPKKAAKPVIVLKAQPKAEYNVGERVSLQVSAPNYKGKVQYRVILWDGTKKAQRELWPSIPGYYYNKWIPTGTQVFTIGWPIMEPGPYSVTILVKRAGAKVAYDSYVKTISFVVKPNTVALDKEGQVYGSNDAKNPLAVNSDVYITANNTTLKNVNVNGTVVVNPGKDGNAVLENVTAKKISVLSGGQNSIHIINVKADEMNVNSRDAVRIEADGNTVITKTTAAGYVIFDKKSGTFGVITITKGENGQPVVEFRGNITDTVYVETSATIKTAEGSSLQNLVISTENANDKVALQGTFTAVKMEKSAALEIASGSKVAEVTVSQNVSASITNNGTVQKLENNGTATVGGSGTIETKTGTGTTTDNTTGTTTTPSAGGGGGGVYSEITNENANLNSAINNFIGDLNEYDVVKKLFGTISTLPAYGKSNEITLNINTNYQIFNANSKVSDLVMLARTRAINHGELTSDKDVKTLSDYKALLSNTYVTATGFNNRPINELLASKTASRPKLSAFFSNISTLTYNDMLTVLKSQSYDTYDELSTALLTLVPGSDVTLSKIEGYGLTVNTVKIDAIVNSTNKSTIIYDYNTNDKTIDKEEIKTAIGLSADSKIGDLTINDFKGKNISVTVTMKGSSGTVYTYKVNYR